MLKLKKIIASAMSLAIACTAVPMTASMTSSATSITFMRGDVDGDGSVGMGDIINLDKYLHGIVDLVDLDSADTNCNGIISNADYSILLDYILGIITEFPCTNN